ncbi:MAG: cell envelope integrity protein TolA [Gammaproteobacteria bacterium]|nr:cell envelope integrity protein TolA [Gammaproteobacteria bacterium]
MPCLLAVLFHVILFVAISLANYDNSRLLPVRFKPPALIQATAISQQQLQQVLRNNHLVKQRQQEKLLAEKQARQRVYEERVAKEKALLAAKHKAYLLAEQQRNAAHQILLAKQAAQRQKIQTTKRLQQQAQKLLQQQLVQDQQLLANQKNRQLQQIVNQYAPQIKQAIANQWHIGNNSDRNLTVQLLIRLAADGKVLSIKLLKSSSNTALDRSAIAAVYKASPLPIPKAPELFSIFREIRLTLNPQTVTG